jgi:hypothetical protein
METQLYENGAAKQHAKKTQLHTTKMVEPQNFAYHGQNSIAFPLFFPILFGILARKVSVQTTPFLFCQSG